MQQDQLAMELERLEMQQEGLEMQQERLEQHLVECPDKQRGQLEQRLPGNRGKLPLDNRGHSHKADKKLLDPELREREPELLALL